MNNYLVSIIDVEDPVVPYFYSVQAETIDEAKDAFIEKAFKAFYDLNYTWDDIVEELLNKSIALTITNESDIQTLK